MSHLFLKTCPERLGWLLEGCETPQTDNVHDLPRNKMLAPTPGSPNGQTKSGDGVEICSSFSGDPLRQRIVRHPELADRPSRARTPERNSAALSIPGKISRDCGWFPWRTPSSSKANLRSAVASASLAFLHLLT